MEKKSNQIDGLHIVNNDLAIESVEEYIKNKYKTLPSKEGITIGKTKPTLESRRSKRRTKNKLARKARRKNR